MQSCLVCGELLGNFLRSLDNPQVEVLCLNDEVVAIAHFLLNLSNLLAWETGNDTVYQGSIDTTALVEPLLEVCGQLPQLNVLVDAVLQYVAIEENQPQGKMINPFVGSPLKV